MKTMPTPTIARAPSGTGLCRGAPAYTARVLLGVAALALMLAFASTAGAGVFAYPSSQTIPASGPLPQDSYPVVTMNAAIG